MGDSLATRRKTGATKEARITCMVSVEELDTFQGSTRRWKQSVTGKSFRMKLLQKRF